MFAHVCPTNLLSCTSLKELLNMWKFQNKSNNKNMNSHSTIVHLNESKNAMTQVVLCKTQNKWLLGSCGMSWMIRSRRAENHSNRTIIKATNEAFRIAKQQRGAAVVFALEDGSEVWSSGSLYKNTQLGGLEKGSDRSVLVVTIVHEIDQSCCVVCI